MTKCIKQCKLSEDNICIGCKRTLHEIVEAGKQNKRNRLNNENRQKDNIVQSINER